MESRLGSTLYIEDLEAAGSTMDLHDLDGKVLMISGATGMIGTFLIDLIMHRNSHSSDNTEIIALGRSREKAASRFQEYMADRNFRFLECDITNPVPDAGRADFIIHLASTTHPLAYSTEPIGTITSNVLGTINLLEYGIAHEMSRFVYASSVEVYGENQGDTERFDENYCGYINSNTLRAGYPESKRLCEALCQAYRKQKGIEAVIPRLARTFGPTMLMSDSKAISQFIKKGLAGEDIILKSQGTQLYTYTYAADAASGIMSCLISGKDGEAYNIASTENEITLRDLAGMIAKTSGVKIVFELPDETEKAGYSTATKATMTDGKARREMNWNARFSVRDGIDRTLKILRQTM